MDMFVQHTYTHITTHLGLNHLCAGLSHSIRLLSVGDQAGCQPDSVDSSLSCIVGIGLSSCS